MHVADDGLRLEMRTGFAELRAGMDGKFAGLRLEIEGKFAEMRTGFAEMNDRYASLLLEMRTGFAEQRAEMNDKHASLRHEVMRTSLSLKIWVLTVAGTLLAVMAHGFHWI